MVSSANSLDEAFSLSSSRSCTRLRSTALASTLATACMKLTSDGENDRRRVDSAWSTPNGSSGLAIITVRALTAPCSSASALRLNRGSLA